MSFMYPILTRADKELELKYLIQHFRYCVKTINNNFSSYSATVDNSGALPQLHISKRGL